MDAQAIRIEMDTDIAEPMNVQTIQKAGVGDKTVPV
jgi:hypothetical protein